MHQPMVSLASIHFLVDYVDDSDRNAESEASGEDFFSCSLVSLISLISLSRAFSLLFNYLQNFVARSLSTDHLHPASFWAYCADKKNCNREFHGVVRDDPKSLTRTTINNSFAVEILFSIRNPKTVLRTFLRQFYRFPSF